jgi:hypothetical protein
MIKGQKEAHKPTAGNFVAFLVLFPVIIPDGVPFP